MQIKLLVEPNAVPSTDNTSDDPHTTTHDEKPTTILVSRLLGSKLWYVSEVKMGRRAGHTKK
jgi:hypothetical protein